MGLRAKAPRMDVFSEADVLNAFILTLLSLFAGDETYPMPIDIILIFF